MAAPPILLVADDLSVIASVKRVLAREGYECVLATSAADAVIGFGHLLPGLMLLQPSVESDRGGVVLEELQGHPDAKLLRVILLGETVPGFAWPVIPLPLDPEFFAKSIEENLRTNDTSGGWSVREAAPAAQPPPHIEPSHEPDAWRATSPQEVDPDDARAQEVPEPQAIFPDPTPPTAAEALEDKLFGDLAADVEASAMQSVESSLPQAAPDDEELTRLEDEVRAEAQRRRQSREARAVTVKPSPEVTQIIVLPSAAPPGEESFEDLAESSATPPSRAAEVLARAEQMLIEGRAQSETRARAEEADERALREQASTAAQRAEQAEAQARTEREARGTANEELFKLKDELDRVNAEFGNERELTRVRHENELDTVRADAEAARESHAGLLRTEAKLRTDAERALEDEQQKSAQLEAELGEARDQAKLRTDAERALGDEQQKSAQLEAELGEAKAQLSAARGEAGDRGELESRLEAAEARANALEGQVAQLAQALDAVRAGAGELAITRSQLEEVRAQLTQTEAHLAEARQSRDQAQAEMLTLEAARDEAQAQVTEVQVRLEALTADVTSASELLEETARERDTLRARIATLEPFQALSEKLAAELEAEARRRTGLEAELEDASRSLDHTRTRAESLEATAVLASEKVKVLEAREVMPLALPGKRSLGVARHGQVGLEGLARVVSQLVLSNSEVRLELGTSGGIRTLWFKRGQVIAAESSLEHESLIARARRDGLIDSKQDAELRMLKGATPREQLEALKTRGFIRDIETVPLVQRYTEQVALDAFTEEQTLYRLAEEAPRPEVLLATVPRPTLPMLAESLRRAVAPEVMLEQLGGGESVPVATDSELDLRALGFSERERKMFTWVDGEATIEDLSLASGLKPDLAFRALLVAQLLGIIEVRPGQKKSEPVSGQLDLQRLEAKYDEVQDADYFTILGLPRAAGTEDVRRAFQRLAQEFDPLRFSGHPDPGIQQRAQVVANLLEEAARALEDDRRRVEYARHLLD